MNLRFHALDVYEACISPYRPHQPREILDLQTRPKLRAHPPVHPSIHPLYLNAHSTQFKNLENSRQYFRKTIVPCRSIIHRNFRVHRRTPLFRGFLTFLESSDLTCQVSAYQVLPPQCYGQTEY
ncbi:hypothetical protein BC629DRAFT_346785 [Irpex lacteus]|nr:hypothetical protein BC629DRAFT_346785 [Irpex lacteus]